MQNEPITYKVLLSEINSSSIRQFSAKHKMNYASAMRYLESKGIKPELFRNNLTRNQLAFLQSKNYSLSQISKIFGISVPTLKLLSKEPVEPKFISKLEGKRDFANYVKDLQQLGATRLQIKTILGITNAEISQFAFSPEELRNRLEIPKSRMTDVEVKKWRKIFLFTDNLDGLLYMEITERRGDKK